MSSDKAALRQEMLELRNELSLSEVDDMSNDISANLIEILSRIKFDNILLYSSFNNEVETKEIVLKLESMGRNVFLPVLISDSQFIACKVSDDLVKNKYGILEPRNHELCDDIDIVVCPGVAFDNNFNRLGFGGGYYDRYLIKRSDILKIGLCYDFQIKDNVFPSKHDISMDMIISEKRCLDKNESN